MKIAYVLISVLALLLAVEAQRGGGRSSSRSSSRSSWGRRSSWGSSRRSSGNFFWFWGSDSNSTTTNGTDGQFNYKKSNSKDSFIGYLVTFGGIGFFIYKCLNGSNPQREGQRKIQIQKAFDNFVAEKKSPYPIMDEFFNIVKGNMQAKKWFMKFQTADRTFKEEKANITFQTFSQRDRNSMNFTMSMYDQIGASSVTGVLVPSNNEQDLNIMFEKIYQNRNDAGQDESFDILFYKGKQDGDSFKGTWAFKNHENSTKYTGSWKMYHE